MARIAAPEVGRVRTLTGFALALLLPPLLEWGMFVVGKNLLAVDVLLQLAGVVAVALVGGLWPALPGALWSSLILNYYSTRPFGSLEIADAENLLTVLIFVAVAVSVSLVVGLAARRTREAANAAAEAATLGELAQGVLAAEDTLQSFLQHVRSHFGMAGAVLYARSVGDDGDDDGDGGDDGEGDGDDGEGDGDDGGAAGTGTWRVLAAAGAQEASSDGGARQGSGMPGEGDAAILVPGGLKLVLYGHALGPREQRLLAAFGSQLAALRQRQQLLASTEENRRLAEGNIMRTAILRAVSHDLRTPLAGIKLSVSSLRQQDIDFAPDEEAELLGTIESSSDRLAALIDNLLDMSRLSGDAATAHLGPVHWADAVAAALRGMPSESIRILLEPNTPPVQADFGMLERVIANIAENAQKYAPDSDITVTSAVSGIVGGFPASELRIRDRGRGVGKDGLLRMFQPFQRLDDTGAEGVGLGLAVARGFTEVMGGELVAVPAPGGGLTMIIRLPLSTGVRQ